MDAVDKALAALIRASGLAKFGEQREFAKTAFGLGHGDANTLIHAISKPAAEPESDAIYVGPKAHMRPIHDLLIREIGAFGEFEIAPKKGYVSLRRKKQFAMIGPATNARFEVGLNLKGVAGGLSLGGRHVDPLRLFKELPSAGFTGAAACHH